MSFNGGDPKSLFARVSCANGVLTAELVGPSIGEREGDVIAQMVEQKLDDPGGPVRFVVLDFDDVAFINSAGLGRCVVIRSPAKTRGAQVVLYRLRKDIEGVFKMSRLDKIFTLVSSDTKLAKLIS